MNNFFSFFSFRNPENNQLFNKYIDNLIDLNSYFTSTRNEITAKYKKQQNKNIIVKANLEPFRISEVIINCHKNKSIYQVMKLSNYVNLTEEMENINAIEINQKITQLINSIKVKSVVILTDEIRANIKQLASSELYKFDSGRFLENVSNIIFILLCKVNLFFFNF